METRVLFAIALCTVAGLSTGIGGAMALFAKRTNKTFLAASLGFSAGVMIYVSFVKLFFEARESLIDLHGAVSGTAITAASFFTGMILIAMIDRLVPAAENPHVAGLVEDLGQGDHRALHRVGILTALAIAMHNLPEGMATYFSALTDVKLGIAITVAIALHNIPEGIAVSVPVFYSTGSRRKAFWYSLLSGLAEPVGAVVAYLALRPFLTDALLASITAGVAGIMVFISLDQLIPNAKRFDEGHAPVYGLMGGMVLMAVVLVILSPVHH